MLNVVRGVHAPVDVSPPTTRAFVL